MSSQYEGRSSHYDLIDDLIESPLPTYSRKSPSTRVYSTYSSLPTSLNKTEQSSLKRTIELRDRLCSTLPRSNSSLLMVSNDQRRKEIDQIIKNLYDGKLMTTMHDDQPEPLPIKNEKESKNTAENLDLLTLDGDSALLQRELQEKELDIIHLRKEIQELRLENKLFKSKGSPVHSHGYSTDNQEIDALRREKEILRNELHASQELVGKLQQNAISNRSNKIEHISVQQKEAFEKKIKTYETQMRTLMTENEKNQRNSLQIEGFIGQLKREKEELHQKLNEAKKRNDELFYQELNVLRNDLKMLKQKNNELFDENHRLQQQQQRSIPDSRPMKIERSDSPNVSEASDSTNYLTTVSLEHYHTRRAPMINGNGPQRSIRYHPSLGIEDINRNKSKSIDQPFRALRNKRTVAWDEENIHLNEDISKYDDARQVADDSKVQYHQSSYPIARSTISYESSNHIQDGIDRRSIRRHTDTICPRRPYAPLSISDIHLNDVVKFSRPGGKITKGVVKYIGSLPDKTDQYLGLELEDEESKHDGIYQDQRLFQCKPNKGLFVAFNKVIMAWSER